MGHFRCIVTDELEIRSANGEEAQITPGNGNPVWGVPESSGRSPNLPYRSENQSSALVPYNAVQTEQQPPGSAEPPRHTYTNVQGRERCEVPVVLGHLFENNKVNGNARQIQGDVGFNLEGNPGHRTPVQHRFIGNQAHENGRQIQGKIAPQAVDQVLKDWASRKNERAAGGKWGQLLNNYGGHQEDDLGQEVRVPSRHEPTESKLRSFSGSSVVSETQIEIFHLPPSKFIHQQSGSAKEDDYCVRSHRQREPKLFLVVDEGDRRLFASPEP